jgi:hypothetical protein
MTQARRSLLSCLPRARVATTRQRMETSTSYQQPSTISGEAQKSDVERFVKLSVILGFGGLGGAPNRRFGAVVDAC